MQNQNSNKYRAVLNSIFGFAIFFTFSAHSDTPVAGIDPDRITISGVSSGANMANQLHLAFPELFSGVGMVAGVPWGCAEGSLTTAFSRCMAQAGDNLDAQSLLNDLSAAEENGAIGNQALLADDRAWLFHGQLDTVVGQTVMDAAAGLYRELLPPANVNYVTEIEAAHNFPTLSEGSACDATEAPYLGNCNYDTAGQILQFLYPEIEAADHQPVTSPIEVAISGESAGIGNAAWLYIPPGCETPDAQCGLHLVLHGCSQSHAQVGMDFITGSGFLPWAAGNDIVLAFPQAVSSAVNPLACWDWWGYTGEDYLSRDGAQLNFLAQWVRSLAGLTE
ncbi:MAG TPA: PHB depolymerase family esterase [Xanthomonadales bacterium]|nr:PHB depolymerase family esterase [Xanthomonadales bacterium]